MSVTTQASVNGHLPLHLSSSHQSESLAVIHTRLLRATREFAERDDLCRAIRQVIVDNVAVTAIHLRGNELGRWDSPELDVSGEAPSGVGFTDELAAAARTAFEHGRTQVQRLKSNDLELICVPISVSSARSEVIAAIRRDTSNLASTLQLIELAAQYQGLWARGESSVSQWKLNSLAAIIELVSKLEDQPDLEEAAAVLANDVAKYLDCARVAVALNHTRGSRLVALSGMSSFDRNSESIRTMQESISECHLKGAEVCWPPIGEQTPPLAHRELAETCRFSSVFSVPLTTPQGHEMGVWLFASVEEGKEVERLRRFIRAASPRVANALAAVSRSKSNTLSAWPAMLCKMVADRRGWLTLVGLALCSGLLAVPMPYQVRCQCVIEPVERRFAVAPFTGIVDEGYVDAGDIVRQGTLLAKMDGRELALELSAIQAKRAQASKQRDVQLAERSISDVVIAQLEGTRLDAQLELLTHRTNHLQLRSPVDGVVLRGSLEKSQSAPVEMGQVLYEIGPLDQLSLEVEVPSDEMAQVRTGQDVKVWIEGFEREPIDGVIEDILPQSELRDQRNVFIAKLNLENTEMRFRPGMRGSARITGPRHSLAWNLFHKPWEFLLSRLAW